MKKILNAALMKLAKFEEGQIILSSVCLGLFVTIVAIFATRAYAGELQADVAANVLRFHVLANSDSMDDQELKLAVRDTIMERYAGLLDGAENASLAAEALRSKIPEITADATAVVRERGYDYDVSVLLEKALFPEKTYGEAYFPAGEYNSLRVEIGAAAGKNWWCVMFPPLCFVDIVTKGEISENGYSALGSVLPGEAEAVVLAKNKGVDKIITVKFKMVEFWQNRLKP